MAWTRKSSSPHCFSISAKVASMLAALVTSQGTMISAPIELASGRTRFSRASPWKVKATLAPLLVAGLGDAPGDRALVGDAHDEALFSGHQLCSSDHASFLAG